MGRLSVRPRRGGTVALAFLLCSTGFEAAHAADLAVSVTGVRSDQGFVRICLASEGEKADFPDCRHARPSRRAAVKAHPGSVEAVFHDVFAGTWAVAAFHDMDGDGVLNTNLLGIPREGVGASRDPRGLFGPPRFDQAAFRVAPEGGTVTLTLVYP